MAPAGRRPWLALLPAISLAAGFDCKDAADCEARVQAMVDRLGAMKEEMQAKQLTLSALEELRTGILSGKRVELPSAQRQHLERGSPLIAEVSFDARHRPVSTNVSRHFKPIGTIAVDKEVVMHTFLALKRGGPGSVLAAIDSTSALSIYDPEGPALLESFGLGHAAGRTVTHMVLSGIQDGHLLLTADDTSEVRIHSLKISTAKRDKKGKGEEDDDEAPKKRQMVVTANFSSAFTLPAGPGGEPRRLTAVMPLERGTQAFVVTGDSAGGIAVFFKNGTMKGRVKVTEDPGGILGLQKSQGSGQMILFHSSHSFGSFSATQMDVQSAPCTGWNSPLFDIIPDSAGSSGRVLLALSDGDVIVFATKHGKSTVCDLALKFPKVSSLPFKLQSFKGHVLGLPTVPADMRGKAGYTRELYFFNLAAMEAGYGLAPSKAVALQASFKPRQPLSFALSAGPSGGGSGTADRSKPHIAIRFEGEKGVEVFELSLKPPPPPKSAGGGGALGGGGGGDNSGWADWLAWFPKIGVFGIALIGVVIWNVRKVTTQKQSAGPSPMDDFDEELFKERLRERSRNPPRPGGAGGAGGGGQSERAGSDDAGGGRPKGGGRGGDENLGAEEDED